MPKEPKIRVLKYNYCLKRKTNNHKKCSQYKNKKLIKDFKLQFVTNKID